MPKLCGCRRAECGWFHDQDNDHLCTDFVRSAVVAQMEDLTEEQKMEVIVSVITDLELDAPTISSGIILASVNRFVEGVVDADN